MGLDQYIMAEKDGEDPIEIGYLRKHSAIHGWMEDLWRSRGCPLPEKWDEERRAEHADNEFNCVPLELSLKDVNAIMKAIRGNKLEPREGFFFNSGYRDEQEAKKEELEIFKEAKRYIGLGYKTMYDSWW
jgi:hypothetical protein